MSPLPMTDAQQVPAARAERLRIRSLITSLPDDGGGAASHSSALKNHLEQSARKIVDSESHLAWTMVMLGSKLWRHRVMAVPFSQRLLLLPHCMRHAEKCPALYDAEGLHCRCCGNCELGHLKATAEKLGCRVLIAEGSPVVMQQILHSGENSSAGAVRAILGVGCLRSLEKAFDKLQLAGIPALAVPLHAANCKNSATDIDWVLEMIHTPFEPAQQAAEVSPPSFVPLLRCAAKLFAAKPGSSEEVPPVLPAQSTESLAFEFLHRGGKFYRPFITLAVFDALTGSHGTAAEGETYLDRLPERVKNAAKTVEIFHKASLIHDDIEDDDPFRYGKETLHRAHGIPMAVNTGDYLLGLGYRMIAGLRHEIAPEIVTEMLAVLSGAHCKLCIGQGTELAWKSRHSGADNAVRLNAEDVLRFYVGKTAPAFEAALSVGVLLAAASSSQNLVFYENLRDPLARYSNHFGAAFQINNDLDDWFPDASNKVVAGLDVHRPTLFHVWADIPPDGSIFVTEMFDRFQRSGVFDRARQLAAKYSAKARETARSIDIEPLRNLLLHFVETLG